MNRLIIAALTCGVGVELHEQGVFAQASAQEERVDVMSCPSHGLQNVPRAELKPEKKRHMKEREREREVFTNMKPDTALCHYGQAVM